MRSRRARSRPAPAIDLEVGVGSGRPAGGGLDEDVQALAGHEPADADHQAAVLGEAEVPPGRGAGGVVEGHEPLDVHPGRDDDGGQVGRRPLPALGRRVAAGGHHQAGAAQHPPERLAGCPGAGRAP
jgi:hypothetical protein